MATSNRRKSERVIFERGIDVHMGIDGTWRRGCTMEDVSETGTRLTIHGSIEGLQLKEFFLLLSSTGLAFRRCALAWINGDQIGAKFVTRLEKKKQAGRTSGKNSAVEDTTASPPALTAPRPDDQGPPGL
jgi:hypothetical protein